MKTLSESNRYDAHNFIQKLLQKKGKEEPSNTVYLLFHYYFRSLSQLSHKIVCGARVKEKKKAEENKR